MDPDVVALAERQFNRVARRQLAELGLGNSAIAHYLRTGTLVSVEEAVFAIAPVLPHDPWGRWMGATLTAPETVLSHGSAVAARGIWTRRHPFETVTRLGNGGPRRHGNVLVYRSETLARDRERLHGIPITTMPRTLVDIAPAVGDRTLAWLVREAVRLELTTVEGLVTASFRHRGRRGVRKLARVLARYSGLPLERARSGAEVRALEVFRSSSLRMPRLNVRIAGEEADLSWPEARLIVEIDGGPFHLDAGEDERKQAVWEAAGWTVRRLPSDDVYERPHRLITLAPNVPE